MANKFPLILNTSANQIQEIASGDNLDLTGCKIVGLQGINSAGIVTFTKSHVGAATTWGEDLVVTGNARVTGILTIGTNSVTISGNDVNITGVTTSANFKTGTSNLHNVGLEIAGINVLGANTPIGTGATIYNSGDVVSKAGAEFQGIVTASNYVGTINTPAQPNITSLGTLSALNVSGNVSIGGTLTYEDVTNIDSVGIVTARTGLVSPYADIDDFVDVGSNIQLGNAGVITATTFKGDGDFVELDVDGHTELDNVNIVGVTTFHSDIFMGDADILRIGGSSDLQLYHDGNSHVSDRGGTGALWVESNNQVVIKQNDANHFMAIFNQGGSSELRFNNSTKIETTNTGAVITGILTATGNVDIAHGSGQAHYQITQTSGNTVKMGIVSGSEFEISGSSNNNIVIKRAGATRVTVTSSGVNFGGTDYGFGATPGGTPAGKNVFLAIGDSDTGIVQDGDGQLELWANATEVANINAIDGYTSVKPITTTGTVTAGNFVGGLPIANGSNNRIITASSASALNAESALTFDGNQFYLSATTGRIEIRAANGSTEVTTARFHNAATADNRVLISCEANQGGDPYIKFDSGGTNFVVGQRWVGTTNNLLVMGAGENAQNILGLFIKNNGYVGINKNDPGYALEIAGNMKSSGVINVGSGTADNDISRFTNGDAGNEEFNHLNGRVLHSNGSGWDGHSSTDGCDPIIVCSTGNRGGNSDIGDSIGLLLHSNSSDSNDYSPLLAFSSKAGSGNYNSVYAAIVGKKTGQAADTNWNAGSLYFHTAGKEANRASDQYMDSTPDFFIDRRGYTGAPRHPRFKAYKSSSNWGVSGGSDLVWDQVEYNIGSCYNTSNGRFTAPCDGFYHLTVYSITYGAYTNAAIYVKVNGNRQQGGDTHFTTTNNWENVGWTNIFKLTAGQYVSVETNQTVTYHGGTWSTFAGYLVSSESW